MSKYDKAIVAFLGALVTLLATFGLELSWASEELIAAVGSVISTALVYLIPNKAE